MPEKQRRDKERQIARLTVIRRQLSDIRAPITGVQESGLPRGKHAADQCAVISSGHDKRNV
eukprot:2878806-Pyramimonas_sp.AAC.1